MAGMRRNRGQETGRRKKNKKDNLNNRMALVGIILVVLSLAVIMQTKGMDLRQKDLEYQIREENLEAQVSEEQQRSEDLQEYRVYVQTKQYIEKIAKEKLGLVNKDEILLKPAEKK